jgi:hypothetical protein
MAALWTSGMRVTLALLNRESWHLMWKKILKNVQLLFSYFLWKIKQQAVALWYIHDIFSFQYDGY